MTIQTKLRAACGLGAASLALALAGCGGGASVNNNNLRPVVPATPAIYGLEPTAIIGVGAYLETSGIGTSDLKTGYITGAVASTAKPPVSIQSNGTIPLGFSPGGQFIDSSFPTAVGTGASIIFRAYISNGNDANNNLIAIDPTSVKLTSPEVPAFQQAMSFTSNFSGPLANGQYTTGTFTLPFATPGLHTLVASVSDKAAETTTTTFHVAVVNSSTACVLAQIVDADGAPVPGATATITGDAGVALDQKTADAQGIVILFATPQVGGNTITVTHAGKTATDTKTLTGGGTLDTITSGTPPSTNPYQITLG